MKINTNELKKEIVTELSAIVDTVVYQRTILPIKPPYVVFEIRTLNNVDGKTHCNFEVNVFDKSQTNADANADAIQEFYDHYDFQNDKVAFYTYISTRQNLTDEDKTVKRIRLVFDLYLYSKEA